MADEMIKQGNALKKVYNLFLKKIKWKQEKQYLINYLIK